MAWNHDTLYKALVKAGLEHAKRGGGAPLKEPYVKLFDQKPNCAVLYRPGSAAYGAAPLHINETRQSWPTELGAKLREELLFDESSRDPNGFLHCSVRPGGWAKIAEALKASGVDLQGQ